MLTSDLPQYYEMVSTEVLKGNERDTGKLTYVSAKAVRSPDFKKVYFVAIKFKAAGVRNQIGVWAVSGKLPQRLEELAGLTLAINPIAQHFTVWSDGNKTQAQIALNDAAQLLRPLVFKGITMKRTNLRAQF